MSNAFRELLRKVGSGAHTSKDLQREEAAAAMRMMLHQEATPAQIGAFMIAHRIKRPTSEELAGLLDAWDEMADKLQPAPGDRQAIVLGVPYDGRSRTAPVTLLTALLLATAGIGAILHGGDTMPTKYGITLVELWQRLGVDWVGMPLHRVQSIFDRTGLGFMYLPDRFPAAHALVPYRDQIGKRPPIATVELIWVPYHGIAEVVAGYVHPPTETLLWEAAKLRGMSKLTTVKGLEGSCDLPRDRTAIVGIHTPDAPVERLFLHPRDYGFPATNVPLESVETLVQQMQEVLQGASTALMDAALWNGGFYLWHCGVCADMKAGIDTARDYFTNGKVANKLEEIHHLITSFAPVA